MFVLKNIKFMFHEVRVEIAFQVVYCHERTFSISKLRRGKFITSFCKFDRRVWLGQKQVLKD